MVIKADAEAKKMIENLCHGVMINTAQDTFLPNLTAIIKTLSSIELIQEEKPVTPESANV